MPPLNERCATLRHAILRAILFTMPDEVPAPLLRRHYDIVAYADTLIIFMNYFFQRAPLRGDDAAMP
jgi:hypothetical protein